MMFTDVTKMVIDLTNQLSPILVGLNVALVVSAAAIFAPTALDTWSGSLGRFVRRPLTLNRAVLAR